MEDAGNQARNRVISMRNEFESIAKKFSDIHHREIFNPNDLTEDVCYVFAEAAHILESGDVSINVIPQDLFSPIPRINEFKLRVEQLNTELDRRLRLFDNSVVMARKIFDRELDKKQEDNKIRLRKLDEENDAKEKALLKELNHIKETFDSRLHNEVSMLIIEKNRFEADLNKIKSEYNLTETTLTASISASRMRGQLLSNQQQMLQSTNEQMFTTIEDKYKQEIEALDAQHKVTLQVKESETERLRVEMNILSSGYQNEMSKLTYDLQNIDTTFENVYNDRVGKLKIQFEKKKRKLDNAHQKVMDDFTHQLNLENMSSSNEFKLLQNEINQNEKMLAESDVHFQEMLESLNRRTELQRIEKENEIHLLTKMQVKTLKQLEQKHVLDMEQENHDAQKAKYELDQKLLRTQRDGEATRKRLENQITSLTRAKDKAEEEMKQSLKSSKNLPNLISNKSVGKPPPKMERKYFDWVDVKPEGIARQPEVESELRNRTDNITQVGQIEQGIIKQAMKCVQDKFDAEIKLLKLKQEEMEFNIKHASKIKEREVGQMKELEKQVHDQEKNFENDIKKMEDDIQKQIQKNEGKIHQIRDEIQSKKSDGVLKVTIDMIQQENDQEMEQLKNQIAQLEQNHQMKLHDLQTRYEAKIAEEQSKTQEILDDLKNRYFETKQEIEKAKKEHEESVAKDKERWLKLRKEINESNIKILKKLTPRDVSRPSSTLQMTKNSPLPHLQKIE